jgi:hypothetical protein
MVEIMHQPTVTASYGVLGSFLTFLVLHTQRQNLMKVLMKSRLAAPNGLAWMGNGVVHHGAYSTLTAKISSSFCI